MTDRERCRSRTPDGPRGGGIRRWRDHLRSRRVASWGGEFLGRRVLGAASRAPDRWTGLPNAFTTRGTVRSSSPARYWDPVFNPSRADGRRLDQVARTRSARRMHTARRWHTRRSLQISIQDASPENLGKPAAASEGVSTGIGCQEPRVSSVSIRIALAQLLQPADQQRKLFALIWIKTARRSSPTGGGMACAAAPALRPLRHPALASHVHQQARQRDLPIGNIVVGAFHRKPLARLI